MQSSPSCRAHFPHRQDYRVAARAIVLTATLTQRSNKEMRNGADHTLCLFPFFSFFCVSLMVSLCLSRLASAWSCSRIHTHQHYLLSQTLWKPKRERLCSMKLFYSSIGTDCIEFLVYFGSRDSSLAGVGFGDRRGGRDVTARPYVMFLKGPSCQT